MSGPTASCRDPGGGGGLGLNAFTTGNPFSGTKLIGFSIGRGFGALKGLRFTSGRGSVDLLSRSTVDPHNAPRDFLEQNRRF